MALFRLFFVVLLVFFEVFEAESFAVVAAIGTGAVSELGFRVADISYAAHVAFVAIFFGSRQGFFVFAGARILPAIVTNTGNCVMRKEKQVVADSQRQGDFDVN